MATLRYGALQNHSAVIYKCNRADRLPAKNSVLITVTVSASVITMLTVWANNRRHVAMWPDKDRLKACLQIFIFFIYHVCRKQQNNVKLKVVHTRLPSVGFRSWSRFLAVSLQVTWVINPAVGCHYFPPRLQLPPQPLRGLLPVSLLGEQKHNGCEQFA